VRGGRIVGGQVLWRETQGGVHRNQQANVAALPGLQPVELRITALDAGKYDTAYWVEWDNLRVQEGPTTTPARVELDPNTLNPDSNGKWITGRIELEAGYDVGNIDGATVTLNGIPAYIGKQGWAAPLVNADNVADFDADGVLERMVKFERAAVQAIASAPQTTVTVKGRLVNGTPFEGQATIRVLGPQAQKP